MATEALNPSSQRATDLLFSVNTVLANLGEAPVNTIAGDVLPQQVTLALNTIKEVSNDIQSKGWWFNQQNSSGGYSPSANIVLYPSRDGADFHESIPEEAIRYITIRAARIAQTRLIGSEELQKFSYNEELVSLAILQQAHVRNSNGVLDFNDFPAELKGLGVDEVMFLQGNVEEKLGILRLGGELANTDKTKAETELLKAQELKVDEETDLLQQQFLTEQQETAKRNREVTRVEEEIDLLESQQLKVDEETDLLEQQFLTEQQETAKRNREVTLLEKQTTKVEEETDLLESQDALTIQQELTEKQETAKRNREVTLLEKQALKTDEETDLLQSQDTLVIQQELTETEETLKRTAEKNLLVSQRTQLDAETAVGAVAEQAFYNNGGVVIGTEFKTYRDFAAEMRMMGIQETAFQNTPAYKKVELIKDAVKLRNSTAIATGTDQGEIDAVNRILRLLGEPSISALNDNSLASEAVLLMRDTATELQGRGWWFNTEKDVTLVSGTNLQAAEITLTDAGDEFPNHDGGSGLYLLNPEQENVRDSEGNLVENQQAGNPIGRSGTWKNYNNLYTLREVTDNQDGNKDNDKPFRWRLRDANQSNPDLYSAPSATSVTYPWDADWGANASKVSVKQASVIDVPNNALSVEPNDHDATIRTYPRLTYKTEFGAGGTRTNTYSTMNVGYLYDLKNHTHSFPSKIKATVIYERILPECPNKFRDFLEVRTALLLTELYPQSTLDVERLRKLEQEIETYFKDRENDEANYTVFDNYDAASRIGVNRNYSIL